MGTSRLEREVPDGFGGDVEFHELSANAGDDAADCFVAERVASAPAFECGGKGENTKNQSRQIQVFRCRIRVRGAGGAGDDGQQAFFVPSA